MHAKRTAERWNEVILIVYNEPTLPKAYEVEFLDKERRTIDILTLRESDITKIDPSTTQKVQ